MQVDEIAELLAVHPHIPCAPRLSRAARLNANTMPHDIDPQAVAFQAGRASLIAQLVSEGKGLWPSNCRDSSRSLTTTGWYLTLECKSFNERELKDFQVWSGWTKSSGISPPGVS